MKNLIVLIVSCSLLFTQSCKDKDLSVEPSLPQFTRDGRNTFGCYVNGAPFIADNYHLGWGDQTATSAYLFDDDVLKISVIDLEMDKSAILLESKIKREIGHYELTTDTSSILTQFIDFSHLGGRTYYVPSDLPGIIKITRLTQDIVSGTFEFIGVSSAGDTVQITDGRFDIELKKF